MAIVFPRYLNRKPIFTLILIIINVIVFIWTYILANPLTGDYDMHIIHFGFTPSDFFNGRNLHTIVTSMFIHGDILHIAFNMFYLFLFAVDIEVELGRISFLSMYFFSGIFANLIYGIIASIFMNNPNISAIGASGAISGVMGTYLVLFPHNTAYVYLGRLLLRTRAYVAIIFYFALEIVLGIFVFTDGTAHWAHIGGFTGSLIFMLIVYRSLKLEDR